VLQDIMQLFYAQSMQTRRLAQQAHTDELMEQAMRYLQENAGQPLSMKVPSRSLNLSPVQFSRRFQQKFQTSPSDYLASLRTSVAGNLLLETNLTIHEVAQRCVYQNTFYLGNLFSREMQMMPGQFRKTHPTKI
jgi:transcriptional regulator GlxA family with amidase domain